QIPFSLDELIATCQFLKRRQQQGQSVLRVFFVGDTDEDDGRRDKDDFAESPSHIIQAVFSGGVRWWCPGLLICIAVGVLLMFSRVLLGATGAMADAHHLLGALVITISVIALAESGRALRFINLFLALALMICAFVIPTSTANVIASLLASALIMAASIPKGPVQSQYGRWSRLIV
ncbi:MAG: hypothetical protein R3177_14470, partial [Arsukibacterium sp.]|nr:hypothetical protein [Arsukibacterium sp.]